MNCQEFEELAGAYALDALLPEERRRAEEHLAACPSCQKLAQELRSTAHLLPLSVKQVPHTPQKEALLSRVQASEGARGMGGVSQGAASAPPPPQLIRRKAADWRVRTLAAVAALLLVLLGGMTAWNISLQQQLALRSAPSAVYALKGLTNQANISGEFITLPQQGETLLIMHDLPTLEGSQVYQGWLMRKNQPSSIGVLTVQQGVATLRFKGEIQGFDAVAVSREPGPLASPNAPRGQVIALGSLTSEGSRQGTTEPLTAIVET